MVLMRELVLLSLKFNIQFKAVHVKGCMNQLSDAISRLQWDRFKQLAPSVPLSWSPSEDHVINFLVFLASRNLTHSTAKVHLSALSYKQVISKFMAWTIQLNLSLYKKCWQV